MTGLRLLSCVFFLATSSAMGAVLSEGEVIFNGDNVIVGQETDGALTVTPPDVLVLDSLSVAQDPGVVGTVLVDGAGITTQNSLSIGSQGIGTLTVQNGGQLTHSGGGTTIGSNGIGRLEVLGAGSMADLAFLVGGGGQDGAIGLGRGEVLVSQGAELLTHGSTIGNGGVADVIIEGNGSLWRGQREMDFGNASLILRDGGRLIHTEFGGRKILSFGAYGGTTTVLISGQGSLLSSQRRIYIGESGQAFVRVEEGASVTANTTGLGQNWFSGEGPRRGILELDGLGTTWTTNELILGGDEGHAEIQITGGAVLNVTGFIPMRLGGGDNSTAVVTIDGPHSRWNTSGFQGPGSLIIGDNGRGELRITGGAYHENMDVIIESAGSKALVSGAGSHWNVQGNLGVLQGEILIADGASMQIPSNLFIGEEGSLQLDGGELLNNPENSSIDNRGQISGDGQIHNQVFNESTGTVYVGPGQRLDVESLESTGFIQVEGGEL